ncbi:MAG: hypothetical protein JWQ49_5975 [Edaphobacter sp.]|nr:hypothetical protein [Edaphobacter sp.]
MRVSDAIADFTPATLLALGVAALAALVAFAIVFLVTSRLALGLDFLIIVGFAVGIAVGIGAFIVTFKKIRSSISD